MNASGRRRGALLACWLLLASPWASAGAEPVAEAADEANPIACDASRALEVARRIQARYESLRDVSADFEQTTSAVMLSGAALAEGTRRRGRVVFAKPARMRWSYQAPEPSLVVSDGKQLWIYDPAAGEASRMAVDAGYLAGAALQFLMGDGRLLETFTIAPLSCGESELSLDLTPRQPASYERLGLVADESTGEVRQTSIVDLFGNRTRIRFENLRSNLDPPAETFVFQPPPGVEVIEIGRLRDRPR